MLKIVQDPAEPNSAGGSLLDEIVRDGARQMRVAEVWPLLYLHGLSSSDFGPALEEFLGSDAGLSAATITRLPSQWQDEARAFNTRSLAETDYVYCWVDG